MQINEKSQNNRAARTAAFFDLDNTLIHGDSQGLEIEFLVKRGQIAYRKLVPILIANFLFKRDLIRADRMVQTCLRIYRDLPTDRPATWIGELYREMIAPRLSAAMVDRVRAHRSRGHLPVILSASLQHLIEPVATDLGIAHILCTELEVDARGLFTGRPAGPVCVGQYKTNQAARLAQRLNIDLAASYAYSDHHADMQLFDAVGHPVVVSPTVRLRRTALRRHWKIISR